MGFEEKGYCFFLNFEIGLGGVGISSRFWSLGWLDWRVLFGFVSLGFYRYWKMSSDFGEACSLLFIVC